MKHMPFYLFLTAFLAALVELCRIAAEHPEEMLPWLQAIACTVLMSVGLISAIELILIFIKETPWRR